MKQITFAGDTYFIPQQNDRNWLPHVDKLLHAYENLEHKLARLRREEPAIYGKYIGTSDNSIVPNDFARLRKELPATAGIKVTHVPDALPAGDVATIVLPNPISHR